MAIIKHVAPFSFHQEIYRQLKRLKNGICAASFLFLLFGCGSGTVSKTATPAPLAALAGKVYGDQQPVGNAQIQLYAVGASGDGSYATALITQIVTSSDGSGNAANSNANPGNGNNSLPVGSFALAGDYQCPSSATEVYAVATGGNPGLASGTNNKALALMAALGPCGDLGSSMTITINELTTIASIASLASFTKSYSAIGSGTSDSSQLETAISQVSEYANIPTGAVPGPTLPAGYYASSTEIKTLGNAVASCVKSVGGVAGDGSLCGQLFTLATPPSGTPPTETVGAILNILKNPSENVCAIYSLSAISSAFSPTLPRCPANWSLPILAMTLTPVLSVGTDTYTTVQTVSISDSTSGATIYYTTDGTTPTASSTRYGGPITVSSSEIIQAIAIATGYAPSAVATATYTINLPPAPTPTYSPLAGTYTSSQTVSISDSSPGAAIYYTTNGSPPTTSATKYAGPILVSSTETIQAIAVATGYSQSAIASAAFTINLPPTSTPVFSPVAGTYTAIQNVSISDSTSGAKIYYTTDGSTPSITSTMYSGAINISATETVQAIAVASGYSQSALATAAYTINIPQVATPTFSPAGGTYTSVQTVTIAVTTSGASIYYTTDGTAPTTNSTKYTSAIAVGTTETIQAIAVATGYKQSALASSTYTINIPQVATPLFSIGGGTYSSIQTVTISDSTSGAMIYYTTNGIAPTTSSTKYTGAITVSASETIQAIAVATGFTQSITASATYTINLPQTATPTLSVPAGTYTSAQLVTLSDSTAGATIYYTTNGTTPTIASTKYTTGINVSTTETVEAIALATGYTQSAVASAMYTLAIPMATLTLSASPNPQGVGEAVVITANVTVVNSSASTAGTFTVTSNGGTICGPAITNTPTGFTCSVTNLAQGTHSISATYVGTYNGGLQANAGPISVSILPVAVTPGWISTCSGNLCSIFSWEYVGVPGEYVGWALGQGAVPNCSAGPSAPNPSNFAKGSILNVIGCASGYEPSPVYSAPVQ